jgi:hypothetical protein
MAGLTAFNRIHSAALQGRHTYALAGLISLIFATTTTKQRGKETTMAAYSQGVLLGKNVWQVLSTAAIVAISAIIARAASLVSQLLQCPY